jgi:hypothetical protein
VSLVLLAFKWPFCFRSVLLSLSGVRVQVRDFPDGFALMTTSRRAGGDGGRHQNGRMYCDERRAVTGTAGMVSGLSLSVC